METPLLNGNLSSAEDGDYRPARGFKEIRSVFWIETVKLWKIAGPIVFNMMCQFGINTVTTIFVGHIGALELSAVSISLAVIGTLAFGFMLGMGSALETLCGQAFGAGQVKMLGVYMQRSWVILTVSAIVMLPIYIFATPILKVLGEEDSLAEAAGKFTLYTIPQLFSLAIYFPAQKFLQAQSKVYVLAWSSLAALILHVIILWAFIYGLGWGMIGAAIAYDFSSWAMTLALLFYVFRYCKEGWHGFSWSAFKEIWAFVRLSLASAVMLCLEIWYMMSILILTGHLDNAVIAVAALSICLNINGIQAMLFIGINAAISVRVSNELGSGRPRAAKYSVYVTVFQCFIVGLLCMVIVVITKENFAVIYTSSKELQVAVSKLAFLLGVTMVLNSVQPVIGGVAIGSGWQALVAYINIGCYYVFGLPLGFLLGYKADMGVEGIWAGMICGTALQTILLLIVLYRTNWNKEVQQTSERVRRWGGQEDNDENGII
ncbi:hypothetical protein JCGZ_26074 [Jatropha curcas]|uniref:Protein DETOXIFICATION n=1 Tax=Jatropha curcas TaxID=180498 RepID=A0A067JHJ8_JATCU|nr:protein DETOXIFICATION 35 [Jatropha curcas]KDP22243.1 hypothetical protein JCGZ_26074 [Jatropha curcas]